MSFFNCSKLWGFTSGHRPFFFFLLLILAIFSTFNFVFYLLPGIWYAHENAKYILLFSFLRLLFGCLCICVNASLQRRDKTIKNVSIKYYIRCCLWIHKSAVRPMAITAKKKCVPFIFLFGYWKLCECSFIWLNPILCTVYSVHSVQQIIHYYPFSLERYTWITVPGLWRQKAHCVISNYYLFKNVCNECKKVAMNSQQPTISICVHNIIALRGLFSLETAYDSLIEWTQSNNCLEFRIKKSTGYA